MDTPTIKARAFYLPAKSHLLLNRLANDDTLTLRELRQLATALNALADKVNKAKPAPAKEGE